MMDITTVLMFVSSLLKMGIQRLLGGTLLPKTIAIACWLQWIQLNPDMGKNYTLGLSWTDTLLLYSLCTST